MFIYFYFIRIERPGHFKAGGMFGRLFRYSVQNMQNSLCVYLGTFYKLPRNDFVILFKIVNGQKIVCI